MNKAGIAVMVLCTALVTEAASAESPPATVLNPDTLAQKTLTEIISQLGRPADKSARSGACGVIEVHDWIPEKLRLIVTGESVVSVSLMGVTETGGD